MPNPLSSDTVTQLKTDPTAALAASLILVGSFPDLVAWAMRALGGKCVANESKANGVGHDQLRKAKGSQGIGSSGAGGSNGAARSEIPRAKGQRGIGSAAKHDEALLALMQANPGATVSEIIEMNNRPRNSTMLSLERLEKAGLVEHASRGKWIAVDPELLEVPTPKPAGWIEPLSANHVAKHTAAMRVPNELGMAARV